ncbi:hypothetical protein Y1Q_0008723 [Alligator mississippiensis]|uniref:Uncharacterized protein n=1 Tax=Alligator mississippiensis TaxID=8496 RepID=A0A151NAL0_ALLMI|nr:hypothetical protein Y1Q_0008723 [Alligator mississippiensis]
MYLASHPDKLELGPSLTEDSGPGEVELASRLLEEQRTQAAELIGEFGDVFQETPGEARVNAADKFDAYLMPRVDELVENIGQAHYISTLDLTKDENKSYGASLEEALLNFKLTVVYLSMKEICGVLNGEKILYGLLIVKHLTCSYRPVSGKTSNVFHNSRLPPPIIRNKFKLLDITWMDIKGESKERKKNQNKEKVAGVHTE